VDLKADRKAGVLIAQASWVEEGQDPEVVGPALRQSLEEMAGWLGMKSVVVKPKGNLAEHLNPN
jgi:uncharacterized protein YcaQ